MQPDRSPLFAGGRLIRLMMLGGLIWLGIVILAAAQSPTGGSGNLEGAARAVDGFETTLPPRRFEAPALVDGAGTPVTLTFDRPLTVLLLAAAGDDTTAWTQGFDRASAYLSPRDVRFAVIRSGPPGRGAAEGTLFDTAGRLDPLRGDGPALVFYSRDRGEIGRATTPLDWDGPAELALLQAAIAAGRRS
jgi:hypothetical protein